MSEARFVLGDSVKQTRAIQAASVVPPAGKPAIANTASRSGQRMDAGQKSRPKSGKAAAPLT